MLDTKKLSNEIKELIEEAGAIRLIKVQLLTESEAELKKIIEDAAGVFKQNNYDLNENKYTKIKNSKELVELVKKDIKKLNNQNVSGYLIVDVVHEPRPHRNISIKDLIAAIDEIEKNIKNNTAGVYIKLVNEPMEVSLAAIIFGFNSTALAGSSIFIKFEDFGKIKKKLLNHLKKMIKKYPFSREIELLIVSKELVTEAIERVKSEKGILL